MPDIAQPSSAKLQTFKTWIGGQWVDAAAGKRFPTYNPYTAEAWGEIPECDATDVERAVKAAHAAFESKAWAGMTQSARGKLLRRIGDLALQHSEYLGQLETRDNGKLISEMSIQTKFLAEWYYFYAGLADKITG
jgi:acyl-CoA reductase-like NAD-dependent aldehyde dehydrogenase